MAKTQSPCIGVCKFRRAGPAGSHCIGCSMTKDQKRLAKKIRKGRAMSGFVALVMAQQAILGRYDHWGAAYRERARLKGRKIAKPLRKAA